MSDQAYFEFEDVSERIRIAKVLDEAVLDETLIQEMSVKLFQEIRPWALIIDFAEVRYLSSAFFGKMISLDRTLKEVGGLMICCRVQPDIYENFIITKLNRVFQFADDPHAAIALAQGRGFC